MCKNLYNKFLVFVLVASASICCVAQDSIAGMSRIQKRGMHYKQIADSLIEKHQKTPDVDTLYISRPAEAWTMKAKTDLCGDMLTIEGHLPDGSPMYAKMKAVSKATLGVSANYRGLSLGLSLNPYKLLGHTQNTEYRVNYYGNRYGADICLSDLHDMDAETRVRGVKSSFRIPDTKLMGVSANVYYVVNGRRFSYPAAFSHSWIQRRSTGSLLIAGGFYMGRLVSDYDEQSGYLASHKDIDMAHALLGVGYGYNFVMKRHWLVHVSAQPSVMFWKNYTLRIIADESTGEAVSNRLKARFPEGFLLGRAGLTYSKKKYFAGVNAVVQTSEVGPNADFTLRVTQWTAQAFVGVRLSSLFR